MQFSTVRIAIVADYREEGWTSMDLAADMLLDRLERYHSGTIQAQRVCPPFRRLFSRLPAMSGSARAFNIDRAWNRYVRYPRYALTRHKEFDLFHVIDHSYAQLVHALPAGRTIVTCNDLDAFECLFEPTRHRRSMLFRAITRRILSGLSKAAYVTCISEATRQGLLARAIGDAERMETIHLGVDPVFSPAPDPAADAEAIRLIGPPSARALDLLHVGSTIPRKRIDVLLNVFAKVRERFPQARLLRIGGKFQPHQTEQARRLGLDGAVVVLPFLTSEVLAAIYRRAVVVLQPSENEGFGLPLVEAMACGTPVVASDIPALKEVGGRAVQYCALEDLPGWAATIERLVEEHLHEPLARGERRQAALRRAACFSWDTYAERMADLYQRLAEEKKINHRGHSHSAHRGQPRNE